MSIRDLRPFPASIEATTLDKSVLPFAVVKHSFTNNKSISDVLATCPAVSKLSEWLSEGGTERLIAECDVKHPLLYRLLRWIVATNRAHLKRLEENVRSYPLSTSLPSFVFPLVHPHPRPLPVSCGFQFVLKSTPPEVEREFQKLKRQHGGSFWAWHGSPIGNWHNILREGLKNMSGTRSQAHGAVYGPGIYLAEDVVTSLGYSRLRMGVQSWANSAMGNNITMLALCEVVSMGDIRNCVGGVHRPRCSHNHRAPFYRIEAEECVVTRFCFIYRSHESDSVNAQELVERIAGHRDYLRESQINLSQ